MGQQLMDVDGNRYFFDTDEEAAKFLNKELTFWKNQLSIISQNTTNSDKSEAKRSTAQSEYIATMIDLLEMARKSFLSDYDDLIGSSDHLSGLWIPSESDFVTRWIEIRNQDAIVSQAFFDSIRFNDSSNISDFRFMRGYLLAYEFSQEEEGSFTSRAEVNHQRMTELLKIAHSQLSKSNSVIAGQITANDTMHSQQEKGWKSAIERLEHTYTADLRLKAPAKYWEEKAKRNAKQGYITGSMLLIFLLAAAYALYTILEKWLSGLAIKVDLTSLGGIFIFVAFLSTLVFITRTLSKLTFSAFHLQRDAEERQQLTHVYLALIKETSMDKDTQNIIIQSLFSRTETGLLQNESGPTIPGLVELIGAVKKP
ncbi:hypothetical protein SAMN05216588_101198 [Pseudomonas flavescens]|uniref:DUF6161 domain-containing protein n=1 Tax=Phytopseudomonas flavescens TaxID=29435 RepID=A0A1G7XN89_9GAMM|nr:DUF6161 domain-containing protein [Pseudomonas flavescens]SDG85513.1 hypothetical protein SAMN05216588_101198 [Pseudomonas flavescens]